MRMITAGHLAERLPRLDRYLPIGLRRQVEDDLRCIDIGLDARSPLSRATVLDAVVQLAQALDLTLRVPGDAFAAVAELVGERSERRVAKVGVGIVTLDDGNLRGGDTGEEVAFAFLPIQDLE